jgi:cell division protein FtsQ
VVAALLLLGGAWLWLRDSSLVAVTRVTVTGATGADAGRIRSALAAAARTMTTLDVHMDQLRGAVAPYPVVKDVRVSTQFPHGMRIRVIEQQPVAVVVVGGRQIAVAGDGTLLHDAVAPGLLPQIPLRVAPGGRRLTDPDALHAVALLDAAPYQWLGRLSQVVTVASQGLVAQVRGGPSIYFGNGTRLIAKWAAAAVVLADPGSAGALYIDVTDPQRPAAGAGSAASADSSSAAAGSSVTATGSTSAAPGSTATAAGSGATATGSGATATGSGATATGSGATATGSSPASTGSGAGASRVVDSSGSSSPGAASTDASGTGTAPGSVAASATPSGG